MQNSSDHSGGQIVAKEAILDDHVWGIVSIFYFEVFSFNANYPSDLNCTQKGKQVSRVLASKFSVPGGIWRKTLRIWQWLFCTKVAKLTEIDLFFDKMAWYYTLSAGCQHWNCCRVPGSQGQWWALPPTVARSRQVSQPSISLPIPLPYF